MRDPTSLISGDTGLARGHASDSKLRCERHSTRPISRDRSHRSVTRHRTDSTIRRGCRSAPGVTAAADASDSSTAANIARRWRARRGLSGRNARTRPGTCSVRKGTHPCNEQTTRRRGEGRTATARAPARVGRPDKSLTKVASPDASDTSRSHRKMDDLDAARPINGGRIGLRALWGVFPVVVRVHSSAWSTGSAVLSDRTPVS
jgi:hypothetical protein